MKFFILLIAVLISLNLSAKHNDNEVSLSDKIKNSHYYRIDTKLWGFLENISIDDLIKHDKWNSSLNFKRSVIDYHDNQGVLIDTTSLPVSLNLISKNIKNALPDNLPAKLSATINYNLHFGIIAQRILIIKEKEIFDKKLEQDWVADASKSLLDSMHSSPVQLKKKLANNLSVVQSTDDLVNVDFSATSPKHRKSWQQRASASLFKHWSNFLYQLRFDFSSIEYKHFFSRLFNIFRIPIRASIAKKMSMQETLSYTSYGVHSLGPSFTYGADINLSINPYYIIKRGTFKIQVIRLDPSDPNKVLLKFSHLKATGYGSGVNLDESAYLVEKTKNTLHLSGSNFFKKAFVYHITPLINFSTKQTQLVIKGNTQSYEFDLSHPKAVEAYNYAAIGMTHKTEEIIKSLNQLGKLPPVIISQKTNINATDKLKTYKFTILGSSYRWEQNCNKKFSRTIYDFKKEDRQFSDIETTVSCNKKSSLGFLDWYKSYAKKELHYISGGILKELNTSHNTQELYINAVYAYDFNQYRKKNQADHYADAKKQIEYFNLLSEKKTKLPCPEYKIQRNKLFKSTYNWNNKQMLKHNKFVNQCVTENLKTLRMQIKIIFLKKDMKKFYLQSKDFIIKAIQKSFEQYINDAIIFDIQNTPYEEEEEIAYAINQYQVSVQQKDKIQNTFLRNILNSKYNLFERVLIKISNIGIIAIETLGLPYIKELRLESATKNIFTHWKKIKKLSIQKPLNIKKISDNFNAMFRFPEFTKEYIHFLSIINKSKVQQNANK